MPHWAYCIIHVLVFYIKFAPAMESMKIAATKILPEVLLDAQNGKISFSGRSRPENSSGFFLPILTWIKKYSENPAKKTELVFNIEYFNSATAKCFVDILRILETVNGKSTEVSIAWH